ELRPGPLVAGSGPRTGPAVEAEPRVRTERAEPHQMHPRHRRPRLPCAGVRVCREPGSLVTRFGSREPAAAWDPHANTAREILLVSLRPTGGFEAAPLGYVRETASRRRRTWDFSTIFSVDWPVNRWVVVHSRVKCRRARGAAA